MPEARKFKYSNSADPIGLSGLLPTFRKRVEQVLAAMIARGFHPVLKDTLRTPAEAKKYALSGKGIDNSMHLYGAAADVICAEHGWDCQKVDPKTKKKLYDCRFFIVLGEEVAKTRSNWGGTWRTKRDYPHFQGLEPTARRQNEMRALGQDESSLAARDKLVQAYYRRVGG